MYSRYLFFKYKFSCYDDIIKKVAEVHLQSLLVFRISHFKRKTSLYVHGNIMYMFISLFLVINLFVLNYAGDSNEASDEDVCKEYYEAMDEEMRSK